MRYRSAIIAAVVAALLIPAVAFSQAGKYARDFGSATVAALVGLWDGSSNKVTLTAPSMSADYTLTLPAAVPATGGNFLAMSTEGALSPAPAQRVLYVNTAASAAHLGSTTATTTVMPASAEGTAATDIGAANLAVGQTLRYKVGVTATPDSPGDETLTVNVLFGGKTVGTSGAVAIDAETDIVVEGDVNVWTSHASTGTGAFAVRTGALTASTTDVGLITSWNNLGTNAFIIQLDWGGTTAAADTSAVNYAILTCNNFD